MSASDHTPSVLEHLREADKQLTLNGWADGKRTINPEALAKTQAEVKAGIALLSQPEHQGGSAERRERAVNELLALANLADDEWMRADLERLAGRFSLPPSSQPPAPVLSDEETEQVPKAARDAAYQAVRATAKRRSHHAPEPDSVGLSQFAHAAVDAALPYLPAVLGVDEARRLENIATLIEAAPGGDQDASKETATFLRNLASREQVDAYICECCGGPTWGILCPKCQSADDSPAALPAAVPSGPSVLEEVAELRDSLTAAEALAHRLRGRVAKQRSRADRAEAALDELEAGKQ